MYQYNHQAGCLHLPRASQGPACPVALQVRAKIHQKPTRFIRKGQALHLLSCPSPSCKPGRRLHCTSTLPVRPQAICGGRRSGRLGASWQRCRSWACSVRCAPRCAAPAPRSPRWTLRVPTPWMPWRPAPVRRRTHQAWTLRRSALQIPYIATVHPALAGEAMWAPLGRLCQLRRGV